MKPNKQQKRICPLCHQAYYNAPAISRVDNQTPICPDCGTRQALQSIGISKQETEQILSNTISSGRQPLKEKEQMSFCQQKDSILPLFS